MKPLILSKVGTFRFLLITFMLTLGINTRSIASEGDLSFPFNSDSGKYWQYVSDRVMGGVSDGQVNLEQDGEIYYARLTGNVSTRNNGGFIQLRSGISFANSEKMAKTFRVFALTYEAMVKLMKFILQLMIELIVETIIQQPSKRILIGK